MSIGINDWVRKDMRLPKPLKATFVGLKHRGSTARPHRIVTRIFHWLTGGLLIYLLAFPADEEDLSDPTALALEVGFALALGLLFIVRFIWVEHVGGGSRLPLDAAPWERLLSRAVHYGIYALVLAVVLTGLVIASTGSAALTVFGPNVSFSVDSTSQEELLEVHEGLASGLMFLIALHVLGAAWHWMVRKDGVWESMLWSPRGRVAPRTTADHSSNRMTE